MYIVYHYRTNYLHLTANPYLKWSLIKFQMTFQDSILQQKHCTWWDRQPASSIEKHLFHLTSKCSPGSFLKYFVYCQYNLLPSLIYQRQQARTHIKGKHKLWSFKTIHQSCIQNIIQDISNNHLHNFCDPPQYPQMWRHIIFLYQCMHTPSKDKHSVVYQ